MQLIPLGVLLVKFPWLKEKGGEQKMATVLRCEAACIHNEDGQCKLDEVVITDCFECENFDGVEPDYADDADVED